MNREIKAKWVAALRSGRYQQTRGQLKDPIDCAYCCLGVLAEEMGALVTNLGVPGCTTANGHWENDTHLSMDFRQAVGLINEAQSELIRLNDNERKTFPEIADYIEEHL